MKKQYLLVIFLLPFILLAQETFTISGKIGALNSPAKLFISYTTDFRFVKDSVILQDGKFNFTGTLKSPALFTFILSPNGANIYEGNTLDIKGFYIVPGDSKLNGSNLKEAELTDNVFQEEYKMYMLSQKEIEEKKEQTMKKYYSLLESKENVKELQELSELFNDLFLQGIRNKYSYIKEYKTPLSLAFLDEEIRYNNVEQFGKLFQEYPLDLQNSALGEQILDKIKSFNAVALGKDAPDFTLPDVEGRDVTLSSFRGQYLLIDFWASWCDPCRRENPYVLAAYNNFKDKGFTILGVSLDDKNNKVSWLKAIEDDQLGQWKNVCTLNGLDHEVVSLYSVKNIPQNYLLDKTGKIIAINLKGEDLEKKLKEILN